MDHTVQRNKRMLEKVERTGQRCGVGRFQYTVYSDILGVYLWLTVKGANRTVVAHRTRNLELGDLNLNIHKSTPHSKHLLPIPHPPSLAFSQRVPHQLSHSINSVHAPNHIFSFSLTRPNLATLLSFLLFPWSPPIHRRRSSKHIRPRVLCRTSW